MNKSDFSSKRIIIISNRLPVRVQVSQKNTLKFIPSVGGLATSLNEIRKHKDVLWIGWPGLDVNNFKLQKKIEKHLLKDFKCIPVFLPKKLFSQYYDGFSNGCLWPLCHYFPIYAHYSENEWKAYKEVNTLFEKKLKKVVKNSDIIWVHDYQLMLLPKMLRKNFPETSIGYFHHIPFPSYEIFRMLPWRRQILEGLLGADLIGFHTYSYVRHFLSSILRISGIEQSFGRLVKDERIIKVDTFPLGIDIERFQNTINKKSTQKRLQNLKNKTKDLKIMLSVDRLDFSKGILQRLNAYEKLLENNSDLQEKIVYILTCVPSREAVPEYHNLKREIDECVGRINGKFGKPGWNPIWYLFRSLPFEQLIALYKLADVALVTPLRDGMNLVAKEYLSVRTDYTGVLILSETAGAVEELGEAIIVNPHDIQNMVEAILEALHMPEKTQKSRNHVMISRLKRSGTQKWCQEFLNEFESTINLRLKTTIKLNENHQKELLIEYQKNSKRILFLNYDGTVSKKLPNNESFMLSKKFRGVLKGLVSNPKNKVVILSGKDHVSLEKWFGETGACLVAEQGAYIKFGNEKTWTLIDQKMPSGWKEQIKPIFESFIDRTPGTFIEEKSSSISWNYKKTEPELGVLRAKELMDTLSGYVANTPLHLVSGTKSIEIKPGHINKGSSANMLLKKLIHPGFRPFILCVGYDASDEYMFQALPGWAWSVKVSMSLHSNARFFLSTSMEVHKLLEKLKKIDQ